jgi:FKBP-type peptidyl-prolyl cis-trans isomerase 2
LNTVSPGCTAKIHLNGRLEDGEVFDTTEGTDPITIRLGTGFLMPKFEENILGMKVGETRIFTLAATDAYGRRDESLEKSLLRSDLPPDYAPVIGDIIAAEQAGVRQPVRIKASRYSLRWI